MDSEGQPHIDASLKDVPTSASAEIQSGEVAHHKDSVWSESASGAGRALVIRRAPGAKAGDHQQTRR